MRTVELYEKCDCGLSWQPGSQRFDSRNIFCSQTTPRGNRARAPLTTSNTNSRYIQPSVHGSSDVFMFPSKLADFHTRDLWPVAAFRSYQCVVYSEAKSHRTNEFRVSQIYTCVAVTVDARNRKIERSCPKGLCSVCSVRYITNNYYSSRQLVQDCHPCLKRKTHKCQVVHFQNFFLIYGVVFEIRLVEITYGDVRRNLGIYGIYGPWYPQNGAHGINIITTLLAT